jgi:CRP/FNR family transcriptional regulator, cyclic AMP receptor protein
MDSRFAELQPGVQPLGKVRDYVNEFIDAVHAGSLLKSFSRRETLLLSEYLECFGVPRCSTVLREGDEGDFLAILVTGGAVVTKAHEGLDKVVYVVNPGDIIGEVSMLDGQKRFASCVTTLPSDFAVLTHAKFKALLSDHPRLSNKVLLALLHTTAGRLRNVKKEMVPDLAEFGFI